MIPEFLGLARAFFTICWNELVLLFTILLVHQVHCDPVWTYYTSTYELGVELLKSNAYYGSFHALSWQYAWCEKKTFKLKLYSPFFVDGVQLLQGYTATSRRQFTFYHQVPRKSWYSFDLHRKDERLSRCWSHPVVMNTRPLDWESSALTTRQSLHKKSFSGKSHLKSHLVIKAI